jgi:hypothetical protein
MLSLDNIKSTKTTQNLRILAYGPPGIGKTTFASYFPKPILLQTEDGACGLDLPTFGVIKNLKDLGDATRLLRTEKHDFKTLIIDSLDWMEPLIFEQVCKDHQINSIEDLSYGKGYTYALDIWKQFLEGIERTRAKGMNIVAISHAVSNIYDPPDGESYARSELKLNKKAAALWYEWADCIAYLRPLVKIKKDGKKSSGKAVSAGQRVICFDSSNPAYIAKSRVQVAPYYAIDKLAGYQTVVNDLVGDILQSNKANDHEEKEKETF